MWLSPLHGTLGRSLPLRDCQRGHTDVTGGRTLKTSKGYTQRCHCAVGLGLALSSFFCHPDIKAGLQVPSQSLLERVTSAKIKCHNRLCGRHSGRNLTLFYGSESMLQKSSNNRRHLKAASSPCSKLPRFRQSCSVPYLPLHQQQ